MKIQKRICISIQVFIKFRDCLLASYKLQVQIKTKFQILNAQYQYQFFNIGIKDKKHLQKAFKEITMKKRFDELSQQYNKFYQGMGNQELQFISSMIENNDDEGNFWGKTIHVQGDHFDKYQFQRDSDEENGFKLHNKSFLESFSCDKAAKVVQSATRDREVQMPMSTEKYSNEEVEDDNQIKTDKKLNRTIKRIEVNQQACIKYQKQKKKNYSKMTNFRKFINTKTKKYLTLLKNTRIINTYSQITEHQQIEKQQIHMQKISESYLNNFYKCSSIIKQVLTSETAFQRKICLLKNIGRLHNKQQFSINSHQFVEQKNLNKKSEKNVIVEQEYEEQIMEFQNKLIKKGLENQDVSY